MCTGTYVGYMSASLFNSIYDQREMSVRCYSAVTSSTHYQVCPSQAECRAGKSSSQSDAQAPLSAAHGKYFANLRQLF